MYSMIANIDFVTNVKDCFLYISSTIYTVFQRKCLSKNIFIKLTAIGTNKHLYTILHQTNQSSNDGSNPVVYINQRFGLSLGLNKNECVKIEIIKENTLHPIKKVFVNISIKDYENIIPFADILESKILNQVGCVSEKSKILVWLTHQISVLMHIVKLECSATAGLLQEDTEMIIEPEVGKTSETLVDDTTGPVEEVQVTFNKYLIQPIYLTLNSCHKDRLSSEHCAYVHEDTYHQIEPLFQNKPFLEFELISLRNESSRIFCCPVHSIPETSTSFTCLNHIHFGDHLFKSLGLEYGSKFSLKPFCHTSSKIILHVLMTDKTNSKLSEQNDALKEEIIKSFVKYYNDNNIEYINHNSVVFILVNQICLPIRIELATCNTNYSLFNQIDKSSIQQIIFENEVFQIKKKTKRKQKKLFRAHFKSSYGKHCGAQKIVEMSGWSTEYQPSNFLVLGTEGSGKSTWGEILNEEFKNIGVQSNVSFKVDCSVIKNKLINVIEKALREHFVRASYYAPCFVILDNMDVLCSTDKDNIQDPAAKGYQNRLCSMFVNLVKEFQSNSSFTLVGISNNFDLIKTTRAAEIFTHTLQVPPLTESLRKKLVKHLLFSRTSRQIYNKDQLDLDAFCKRCEGYCMQDMVDLSQKALFEYLQKTFNIIVESVPFSNEHMNVAFDSHVPLSLKGVKTEPVDNINFKSVGGMNKAKELLVEVLIWPSKYPLLYNQCPVKIQTGVLLYGAPGTGKTLLASAISGECGLKCISVKGPELFSKFIGESEEGVRNVFQRARNMKPCILFFDEFDSLAARRGSDSTGVNDRVVNQLLTELDGIENLEGVYVLAATSRPDLIDSALLRPGRLGKHVRCDFPSKSERLDILNVLCKEKPLAPHIRLDTIAEATDHFTGADLLGLLFSAQMMSREVDESSVWDTRKSKQPLITQENLLCSLEQTKPSLAQEDRIKFNQIYDIFSSKKGINLNELKEQKVTSA